MKIFRPKNLIIIFITQYLLQYLVLVPALKSAGETPLLNHYQFFFLVFETILIAAGGYLINDIIDLESDKINKPEKVYLGKRLQKKTATILYVVLNLIGLEIAWVLANQVGNKFLMLIYPAAVFLLYLYSKTFKSTPIIGNCIVSIFCAGVAGIVLFAERDVFQSLPSTAPQEYNIILYAFGWYILFAFLTTFIREIIKDIEDIEGDKALGIKTFPISKGVNSAKNLIFTFSFLTGLSLLFFTIWLFNNHQFIAGIYTLTLILLPLIFISIKTRQSKIKSDYSQLSKWIKWIMLSGLFLLILLWI